MADDGSAQSQAIWPLPKFYFKVTFGSQVMSFQEVSGLEQEAELIEYRGADNSTFSTTKMPGMMKSSTITLKRGLCLSDDAFWQWYSEIRMNTIARVQVTISLIDQTGKPSMVWVLENAWPSKIKCLDKSTHNNELGIDSLEFMHEGLTIRNG